jgi:hypothetical protein
LSQRVPFGIYPFRHWVDSICPFRDFGNASGQHPFSPSVPSHTAHSSIYLSSFGLGLAFGAT